MFDFSKRWKWHKEQQPGSICLVCTHASCISALWSTVPPYLVLTTLFTLQMQPTCKSFEFQEQLLITWTIYCLFTTSEWPREIHIYGNDMTQGLPKWYFPIQTSETAMFYDKTYFNANPWIDYCTFRDTILVCCQRRIVQSLYSLHCYCARVQVGFTQRGRLQLGDGVRGGNSGFFCFCLITRKRFNRRRLDTKLQIQRFSEKAWWIEFREEDAAALLFTGQKSKL